MASVETQVGHIWRRLGFGPLYSDIVNGSAMGTTALIDSLIDRPFVSFASAYPQGAGQLENDNARRLLELMCFGPNTRGSTTTVPEYNPVQERVTWMMQGLLIVGMDVVDLANMRDHILWLRNATRTTYKQLALDIARRPGMIRYLTGDQNVKGHPNENFARECMELFTIGRVDPISGTDNYTQQDVIEVARAVTGWRYNWNTHASSFDANLWDEGPKTFLGAARGAAGMPELFTAITGHPSYKHFVPSRIYKELTGLTATAQVLSELAFYWGTDGGILNTVRAICKRPEFLSDAAILNRTKSPVERITAATRFLGWPGLSYEPNLINLLWGMGQHPFYPPNVSGWPRGDQWLNTTSLQDWNQMSTLMCHQGFNSSGIVTGAICPTIETVYANATGNTVADYVTTRAGLRGITSQRTLDALTAYGKAGLWNRYRAAGVCNLLLMSPEFLAN